MIPTANLRVEKQKPRSWKSVLRQKNSHVFNEESGEMIRERSSPSNSQNPELPDLFNNLGGRLTAATITKVIVSAAAHDVRNARSALKRLNDPGRD